MVDVVDDNQLKEFLSNHSALVVHFSHYANMRAGVTFPRDMLDAIKNKDSWALSCSVVWPNHNMKVVGSVGVIFEPVVSNVLSVSNSDSGSMTANCGSELSSGLELTAETMSESLNVNVSQSDYNEWRVKGAEVKGIFVCDIYNISVRKEVELTDETEVIKTVSQVNIPIEEIFQIFAEYKIFTISGGAIVEVKKHA